MPMYIISVHRVYYMNCTVFHLPSTGSMKRFFLLLDLNRPTEKKIELNLSDLIKDTSGPNLVS